MTDIVWTQEMRDQIYASRKHPNPRRLAELCESYSLSYPFTVEETRKVVAGAWRDCKDDQRRAKQGLAKNSSVWKPIVEKALARCKAPNKDYPLELDVEVAMVTLEMCSLFESLAYWIARGGIPFALRALIRTTEITSSWADHGYGDHGLWIVESRKVGWDRPEGNDGAWALMRAVLAEAIEPVYDEAHGIADAARLASAGLSPNESVLQVMIPFAFPDEAAWARAGAATAIGLAKQRARASTAHLGMFVGVAPVDKAVELLTVTVNDGLGTDDLITALAHHGAAGGVKILEAALSTAPNGTRRQMWGEVLLAVRTVEAMKAFERLSKHPKGKKTFSVLAQQHRELMLANAAKRPGKPRPHKKSGGAKRRP